MRRSLLAYIVFCLVEIATWLAIILWAYDEGGAALAGLLAVVQLVPAALLTPVLAGLGDRMSRGTALWLAHACVLVSIAATTALVAIDAAVPLVAFAATVLTASLSIVRPFHFAALPQLADTPAQLVSANAISSMAEGFALFAGPLLAGLGAQLAGPWPVFAVSTVLAVGSLWATSNLGLTATSDAVEADDLDGWRRAIEGIAALLSERGALLLLLVMASRFVISGAIDVLGVSYAEESLGLGESAAGVLIGAAGIGGLIGGAMAGSFALRQRLAPVIIVVGVLHGCAFACVAALTFVAPAALLIGLTGWAGAVIMVAGRTLLQRTSDDRLLARVFAVQEAVGLVGVAIGAALAPALIDWAGARLAFVPIGAACAVFALVTVRLIRRLDGSAQLFTEEVALLRRVGFLAPLPQYEVERLARNAEWLDVVSGEVVIRQGDIGDTFYVVDTGTYSVMVDDELRTHQLGPGDGFGEIALLRQVPRTATVTSIGGGRLLVVGADDFLAAVTGSPDGADLAAEVTESHLLRDEANRRRSERP